MTKDTLNKKLRGYTLIEILLTVALISMVSGFSIPIFQSFLFRNQVETATSLVTRAIRSAQTYSQGIRGDSEWGVAFISDSAVLFKGSNYISRDQTEDLKYSLQGAVVSGAGEIVFSKHYGFLTNPVTLHVSATSGSNTININEKGIINY